MSRDAHEEFAAIARAAAGASAGIGPEVVTTLRRRRRRRRVGQGAGFAVLAVGAIAVAGPLAALISPDPVPPADDPSVTEPIEPTEPTDVEPTDVEPPEPPVTPTGMACGATEDWLSEMADPISHPVPIGVTAPSLTAVSVDSVPDLVAGISPTGTGVAGSAVEVLDVVAVATRDGIVVGGAPFDVPGATGLEGTVTLAQPLVACPSAGAVAGTGTDLLAPGDYGVRVVVTAREPGGTEDFVAIGGPWALTLLPAGSTADAEADGGAVATAIAALFTCGEPAPSIHTLPTGALTLAADLPAVGWQGMTGVLGTTGGNAVDATLASADVSAALVGADGRVAGLLAGAGGAISVSLARDTTFPLRGEQSLLACGPDGEATAAYAEDGLPPGDYTVWPYLPVLVESVTSAEGETVSSDAAWTLVVANPQQVTAG